MPTAGTGAPAEPVQHEDGGGRPSTRGETQGVKAQGTRGLEATVRPQSPSVLPSMLLWALGCLVHSAGSQQTRLPQTRAATLFLRLEPPQACHTAGPHRDLSGQPTFPHRAVAHQTARTVNFLSCHIPVPGTP